MWRASPFAIVFKWRALHLRRRCYAHIGFPRIESSRGDARNCLVGLRQAGHGSRCCVLKDATTRGAGFSPTVADDWGVNRSCGSCIYRGDGTAWEDTPTGGSLNRMEQIVFNRDLEHKEPFAGLCGTESTKYEDRARVFPSLSWLQPFLRSTGGDNPCPRLSGPRRRK